MMEYEFFSCIKCDHSIPHENKMRRICLHPSIKKARIKGRTLKTYTPEDWEKINNIINNVLHLSVTIIDGTATDFEFPFRYEPMWINACSEFVQTTRKKGDNVKRIAPNYTEPEE